VKNTTQISIAFMLLLSIAIGQVTIDGYAYLDNQTDHSGITITFERTAPSVLTETISTDTDGYFTINLETGIYNVTYSKIEYFSESLIDQSLYSNVTMDPLSIYEHTSLINVPALFATIQLAIDHAGVGDTILVQPGTYLENINYYGKSIVLASLFLTTNDTSYISSTIIDGNQNGSVVKFENGEDNSAVLTGITIQHGNANGGSIPYGSGGGILCYNNSSPSLNNVRIIDNTSSHKGGGVSCWSSSPILSDVTITNNSSSDGGGLSCSSSSPVLSDVTITNNTAAVGGGVYCVSSSNPSFENASISGNSALGYYGDGGGIACQAYSSPSLENVKIANNIADDDGGGIWCENNSSPSLVSVTISNNIASSEDGGGIWCYNNSNPSLVNVTITGNTAFLNGGGIYCWDNSSPSIINTIVSGNTGNYGFYVSSGNPSISYSDFYNNENGEFYNAGVLIGVNVTTNANGDSVDAYLNIQLDPLFVDAANNDYHLLETSPCIDAGDPTSPYDADGSIADMGAYPSPYGTPVPIVIEVPSDYATIQAGLNAASTNDTVLVQPGTYYENIIWPETNGITLLSAGDSSNTIIDGGGISSVIYMNPQTVTIDTTTLIHGFKITNGGNVIKGAGMLLEDASIKITNVSIVNNHTSYPWPDLWGGGMYLKNSNSVIRDLSISNNSSKSGGGIYISDSNPIIENVMIKGNSGVRGGGVSCQGSSILTMTNINLENNSATSGGGINASGDLISIENAFINGNTASNEGGGITLLAPAIFNDVVIKDNIAEQGGGIYTGGNQSLSMSDVSIIGNTATGGFLGAGILFDSGSSTPTFNNVSIMYNHGDGIRTNSGDPNNVNTITISNVNIIGNEVGVYAVYGTNPTIINSNILNNGDGFYNEYTINVNDATNNYWGHSSGPYHPSQNPTGQGDSTNQWVNVTPWLTTPNTDAPPIPAQDVIVSGTGNDFINLAWDPSPLGDFAGFKLYYDTDENGYPYDNSVDIGGSNTYSLTGLNLGTEYFLAVTVYDTDGNESWYSNEVTGVTRVMEVQNLDIAGDEHLYHLITHDPLVTFDYFDSMSEAQTNYHLQISTDSTFQTNIIWDSGEVASDATSIQYTGGALLDGVKYYLRAKVASGSFWSEWTDLTFGMNTEPSLPVQLSLIGDEVTTSGVLLEISNSTDDEGDNLTYDFRLYDALQTTQLDSAIAVAQDPEGTEWEVLIALDDNAQHWWTVQAFDGYEYSELVGPESFLINFENDDPAGFDLTSPLLDESIPSLAPLFTWNPAVDPDPLDTVRYVLYLDTPDPGGETFYPGIDTSFQLDYNLEDNTTYHWKVAARDLNDSETESNGGYQSFTVNTANDLPEYFELLYPVWDEMVVDLQPEFLWEASSDPDDETIVMRSRGKGKGFVADQSGSGNTIDVITGYDFYLSTDSMMTDVVPVEVMGTSYAPIEDLLENQTYYWAVSAVDDSGGVTFSDTASFWTNADNEAPAEFALLLPTEGDVLTVLSPTFTWESSSDPDLYDGFGYHILLGSSPEDMDTLWSGDDTTLILDWELEDNMTYYWSVFAEDWNGLTTFNVDGYQSFTVNTSNDLPEYFELLYPVWDEMVVNLQPEFLWEASSDPDDQTIVMRSRGQGKGLVADQSGSGNTVDMITGYDFYLSTDSLLTDVVPVEVVGTDHSPTEDLLENQTYYWAVSALDDSGGVTFSDTASFWTNADNEAPAEFSLLLPTDAEVLTVLSPTFTWESSHDPDLYDGFGYHILLGSSPDDMDTLWSGEDTTLTLDWDLDDNMTYYWSVFAEDWNGLTTFNVGGYQSFTINQGNDSPSMVELITPDSVMILTLTPEMYWTAALDADPGDIVSYEMHWWGDGIEFDSVLTDTNAVLVTSELEDNTQYFWEVIAMDQTDGISHSEAATFWTDLVPEAPGAFALLAPEDDVAGLSDMPSFEWVQSVDPDPMDYATYTIQIASDSSFVDVVFDANTELDVELDMTEALPADTEYWWKVVAIDTDSLTTESETFKFTVGYVAIAEAIALPTEYILDQNYPNPFNPSTTLRYGLPEDSEVSMVIYDIRGNTVRTIESGSQVAGWYEHVWNGMNDEGQPVSTGLYLTRLRAGSYTKTIKMLYLK
jgi:parallel beta-helix repeat protein